MGNAQRALAILVGWMSFLKVQSEGLTIWKSEVSDLVSLPEDKDKGLFFVHVKDSTSLFNYLKEENENHQKKAKSNFNVYNYRINLYKM